MYTSKFLFGTLVSTALLFNCISDVWAGQRYDVSDDPTSSIGGTRKAPLAVESGQVQDHLAPKDLSSHPIFTLLPEDLRSLALAGGVVPGDVLDRMPVASRKLTDRVWFNGPSADSWENYLLNLAVENGLRQMVICHEKKKRDITEEDHLEALEPFSHVHECLTGSFPRSPLSFSEYPEIVEMVGRFFASAYAFLLDPKSGEFPVSDLLMTRAGNRKNRPEQMLVRHQRFLTRYDYNPTQGFYGEQETDPDRMDPVTRHFLVSEKRRELEYKICMLRSGKGGAEKPEQKLEEYSDFVVRHSVVVEQEDYRHAIEYCKDSARMNQLLQEYLERFPTKGNYEWAVDGDFWPYWNSCFGLSKEKKKQVKVRNELVREYLSRFSGELDQRECRKAIELHKKNEARDALLEGFIRFGLSDEELRWAIEAFYDTQKRNERVEAYLERDKTKANYKWAISRLDDQSRRDDLIEDFLEMCGPDRTREDLRFAISWYGDTSRREQLIDELLTRFGSSLTERDFNLVISYSSDEERSNSFFVECLDKFSSELDRGLYNTYIEVLERKGLDEAWERHMRIFITKFSDEFPDYYPSFILNRVRKKGREDLAAEFEKTLKAS